jgi:hypothetical protein
MHFIHSVNLIMQAGVDVLKPRRGERFVANNNSPVSLPSSGKPEASGLARPQHKSVFSAIISAHKAPPKPLLKKQFSPPKNQNTAFKTADNQRLPRLTKLQKQ